MSTMEHVNRFIIQCGEAEKKITNLVKLRQRNNESVEGFVQRIREVKNKCYSLVLDDRQLAEVIWCREFLIKISSPLSPREHGVKRYHLWMKRQVRTLMKNQSSAWQNGWKIKSWCLVLLDIKNRRSSHLTSLRPIGYLTFYFKKVRSSCHLIMWSHRLKN